MFLLIEEETKDEFGTESEDTEEAEELGEIEEERIAEAEEVEVVIDQLKLLLDVTKLWHKVLRNEADISEISKLLEKPQEETKPVVKVKKTAKKKTTKTKSKSKSSKSRSKKKKSKKKESK